MDPKGTTATGAIQRWINKIHYDILIFLLFYVDRIGHLLIADREISRSGMDWSVTHSLLDRCHPNASSVQPRCECPTRWVIADDNGGEVLVQQLAQFNRAWRSWFLPSLLMHWKCAGVGSWQRRVSRTCASITWVRSDISLFRDGVEHARGGADFWALWSTNAYALHPSRAVSASEKLAEMWKCLFQDTLLSPKPSALHPVINTLRRGLYG